MEKLLKESTVSQESQAKLVLKEVQEDNQDLRPENPNPASAWSTLCGTKLEEVLQSKNNFFNIVYI